MHDQYLSAALFEIQPQMSAGQIEAILKTAFSKRALSKIIDGFQIYPALRSKQPLENVVAEMKDDIEIRPLGTNGMVLQFRYYDRPLSQRVYIALVDALMSPDNCLSPPYPCGSTIIGLRDAPNLPDRPISPKPTRLAALGFVAGMIIGLPAALSLRCRFPRPA